MGLFISLLNDVISKKAIDDEEPLGTFVSDEKTQEVIREKKELIENNPKLKEKLLKEKEMVASAQPIMKRAFLPLDPQQPGTGTYSKILDRDTTSRFIASCKKEGVTVNSACAGVVSVVLFNLLVEAGIVDNTYLCQSCHFVNLRRYWKDVLPNSFGLNIGLPISSFEEISQNTEQNFWEYVRSLQQDIKQRLESADILAKQAYETYLDLEINDMEKYFRRGYEYSLDYSFSNMGDLTPVVTAGGKHVRITHLLRSSSKPSDGTIEVSCHTFRGKFTMTFAHNRTNIRRDFIVKFCERTAQKMQELTL